MDTAYKEEKHEHPLPQLSCRLCSIVSVILNIFIIFKILRVEGLNVKFLLTNYLASWTGKDVCTCWEVEDKQANYEILNLKMFVKDSDPWGPVP